jgi:pimeloyl-ACP methyl ester carboxylesterase
MTASMAASDPPDLLISSRDGTPIAVYRSGPADGPPLVLVHGASADHTTFRVIGPRLADRFAIHAIDRRGRGGSGDTPPYAIEREFEDVAAVAAAAAREHGRDAVDVVGHSYGGRCALGAALLTTAVRRIVSYEGAPTPPDETYGDEAAIADLEALDAAGEHDRLFATFMTRIVGMSPDELARYREDPVWPLRVAAAHTIPRELRAESTDPGAGLDALGRVRQPVLQLLGSASLPEFAIATHALDERLADGRIAVIDGAAHAGHHTHPEAVIEAITAFVGS